MTIDDFDTDDTPRRPEVAPKRLGDVMGTVLRRLRAGDSAESVNVFSQWRSIVGDLSLIHI